MSYLSLRSGETKLLKVDGERVVREVTHRIAGRHIQCLGPGCQYCDSGFPTTTRYSIDVSCAGESLKWFMSTATCTLLEGICGKDTSWKGRRVEVTRRGEGFRTEYDLKLVGATDSLGVGSPPTPSVASYEGVANLGELVDLARSISEMMASLTEELAKMCASTGQQPPEEVVLKGGKRGKAKK